MKEYTNLLMGLIASLALTFLNNDIVHSSLNLIFTGFDPSRLEFMDLSAFIAKTIISISFIGILFTIIFSFLLLKKAIQNLLKNSK